MCVGTALPLCGDSTSSLRTALGDSTLVIPTAQLGKQRLQTWCSPLSELAVVNGNSEPGLPCLRTAGAHQARVLVSSFHGMGGPRMGQGSQATGFSRGGQDKARKPPTPEPLPVLSLLRAAFHLLHPGLAEPVSLLHPGTRCVPLPHSLLCGAPFTAHHLPHLLSSRSCSWVVSPLCVCSW